MPPSVPAEVAALVAALTSKDPRARPSSAGDVAARAERLRTALPGAAAAPLAFPVRTGAAAGKTPTLTLSPHGEGNRAGNRSQRPRSPRTPAGLAAGAVLAVAGIGAASLAGWLLATMPGSAPAHRPSSDRPTTSRQASSRGIPGSRPVAATRAADSRAGHGVAARAAGHARASRPPAPTLMPSPSPPAPSATPTASGGARAIGHAYPTRVGTTHGQRRAHASSRKASRCSAARS